jgi:prepilin-type N-terminal cleavage/methylation domain-containing protein
MRGYTLVELLAVLVLTGVGLSTAVPAIRRLADRAGLIAAREDVIGALVEARTLALDRGGSAITLLERVPSARVEAVGQPPITRSIGHGARGLSMDVGAHGDSIVLRFDAIGLGRFASRTIALTQGGATVYVVVSSYGRVTRR